MEFSLCLVVSWAREHQSARQVIEAKGERTNAASLGRSFRRARGSSLTLFFLGVAAGTMRRLIQMEDFTLMAIIVVCLRAFDSRILPTNRAKVALPVVETMTMSL